MADVAELGLSINCDGANEAADALERVAKAAERARTELEKLGDVKHGGLTIKMAGKVMVCEVKPAA